MSKNKSDKPSKPAKTSSESTPKVKRQKLSFLARMLIKLDKAALHIVGVSTDLTKKSAPEPLAGSALELVEDVKFVRQHIVELQANGWEPAKKGTSASIVVGDRVSISPEVAGDYAFITSTDLVVKSEMPDGKGKRFLVVDQATDHPFGYVPKRHLVKR
jgi:hypothetical protein